MTWHRGLRRLRIVGVLSLVLGIAACVAVTLTGVLGYTADAIVQPLFSVLYPVGITAAIVGAVLLIAGWVLAGFVADGPR